MAKNNENAVKRSTDAVKKPDKKELSSKGRLAQWFRDLKSELKKVVWPTRQQVVNNTLVALVVIVASAVVIWGFDTLASAGSSTLINLVG